MLGMSQKELQEAEKLCDLFDRMRSYAREAKIVCITTSCPYQPAPDVTDFLVSWHRDQPGVVDYINLLRTKERPVSMGEPIAHGDICTFALTMPIGYSPMRDGIKQVHGISAPPRDVLDDILDEVAADSEWATPSPIGMGDDSSWLSDGTYRLSKPFKFDLNAEVRSHVVNGTTPKKAADKRRWSEVHVNGRPKKGWER